MIRHRIRKGATVLAAATAAVLAVTLAAPPAAAAPATPRPDALTASKEAVISLSAEAHAVSNWPALDDGRVTTLAREIAASGLSRSGNPLDTASAIGLRSDDGHEIVRIPIVASDNPTGQSALTVFYDSSGAVATTVEMSFIPLSQDSGTVRIWNDGSLSLDRVVAAETGDAAGSKLSRATYKKGDWWGNLSTCLNNQGIPGWVVAGLSLACGVACAVTLGIGCGVCLAAAIGGWSGVATACVAIANTYS